MKHRDPEAYGVPCFPFSDACSFLSWPQTKKISRFRSKWHAWEGRPSSSFTPPHRIMPLRSTLFCAFVRLSLLSYRHPERSRGIFVAILFLTSSADPFAWSTVSHILGVRTPMKVHAAALNAKNPEQSPPYCQEQTFSEIQGEICGITKCRKSHVDAKTPTWNLRL